VLAACGGGVKAGSGRTQGKPGGGTSGVFSERDRLKLERRAIFALSLDWDPESDWEKSGEELPLVRNMVRNRSKLAGLGRQGDRDACPCVGSSLGVVLELISRACSAETIVLSFAEGSLVGQRSHGSGADEYLMRMSRRAIYPATLPGRSGHRRGPGEPDGPHAPRRR
jgi:hypothetical protein